MIVQHRNRWRIAGLILAIVLLGAEIVGWRRLQERGNALSQRLRALQAEQQSHLARPEPLTAASVADARNATDQAARELADATSPFIWRPVVHDPAPRNELHAYAVFARFVSESRIAIANSAIAVRDDERFGFDADQAGAPTEAERDALLRHRDVTARIVRHLIDARPAALLAIRRGHAGRSGENYFAPMTSLLPNTRSTSDQLCVSLRGDTSALRDWLNAIARDEAFLCVRRVEARAFQQESGRCDFDVTLECVRWNDDNGEKKIPPPSAARRSAWGTSAAPLFGVAKLPLRTPAGPDAAEDNETPRPPRVVAAEPQNPTTQLPIRFGGWVQTATDVRVLLRHTRTRQTRSAGIGETIEAWNLRVQEIRRMPLRVLLVDIFTGQETEIAAQANISLHAPNPP